MNKHTIIITILFLGSASILMTGCISIRTYEEKMKACRQLQGEFADLEDDAASLRDQNRSLDAARRDADFEKKQLQDEIAAQNEEIQNIRGTYDQLINELKDDIAVGAVAVSRSGEELKIVMEEQILFESGRSGIQKMGKDVLTRIGKILRSAQGHMIHVEGHTDDVPIKGRLTYRYPSNWELSASRAGSVIRQLIEEGGVDPEKIILVGYSQYRPVATNKTPEGREKNRRVEITLHPIL
jgi:chemotaxis protein MotB